MSEEIKIEIVKPLPEPEEGKTYKILSAEKIKTQRMGWEGVRVTLEDDSGNQAATMLWIRDRTTANSKLGAFVSVLGTKLSEWKNKRIQFVSWRMRNRQIKLAPPS